MSDDSSDSPTPSTDHAVPIPSGLRAAVVDALASALVERWRKGHDPRNLTSSRSRPSAGQGEGVEATGVRS